MCIRDRCGTNEIGAATAKKMEEFRLVVWSMHGIYGAGRTMDEAFGLIETVEKAVSYTHLDVYKRQAPKSARSASTSRA